MKLNITLDDEQRETLQASADHLAKLRKKLAAVDKQHADFEAVKVKATTRLATMEKTAFEKAGEEAGEAASTKVFAIRHQLGQLDLTLRRLEREYEDLEKEAATAMFIAAKEIRAAHRPLLESLVAEVVEILAPFYFVRVHARQNAEALPAVEQMQHFVHFKIQPRTFQTTEALLAAIESIGTTLTAFLDGEAVVHPITEENKGGLEFPAYV